MIETAITSSVLIIIIIALRYLLWGKISSRLQYALWILVVVRLLLPFSLFESPVSVMNALSVIQSDYSEKVQFVTPANTSNLVLLPEDSPAIQNSTAVSDSSPGETDTIDGKVIIRYIWLGGFILSGAFFAASNIWLSTKLKKVRKRVDIPRYPLPVYIVSELPSPCLYGIVHPAVYTTPESLSDEKRAEYVLVHELTHHRHMDHIWSFIRVLCLCIHWFNPLVWLAAMLSRRDSELACDAGTLRRIGSENSAEYGRTLIEMMTAPSKPSNLFCCATTMTGGMGEMTERIKRIAKQPKTLMITLGVIIVAIVAAIPLTFGSANSISLADAMDSVDGFSLEALNNISHGFLFSEGESRAFPQATAEEIIPFIKELRVGKKEINRNRDNIERDKAHQICLTGEGYLENGATLDIYFNFNSDFTVVWVDNGIKPSFSYTVTKPDVVMEFFKHQFNSITQAVEMPSYSISRLENGEAVSIYPLENSQLADAIIMDYMVKSAAWEGVDISTLKVCFLIRQTFKETDEVHDYYAYLQKDGTAVLQSGTDGQYTVLSQELYLELIESWDNFTADLWLENAYTKNIPRPSFGNMLWMTLDKENEYCAACYQGVTREQIEDYIQTLSLEGWQTVRDLYKHTSLGGLYQKDNHSISVQFDDEQVILYFSLN